MQKVEESHLDFHQHPVQRRRQRPRSRCRRQPYAIGFFGYAYAQENPDIIRPISLEGITISPDTAESGEYPMARPLFIYSDAGIMQSKPQVADYINYFLTYVNDVILDVGYFPASVEAIDQAKQAWLDAMG